MQMHVPDRQKGICMLICHQYANFSDMASCKSLRARLKLPKHAEASFHEAGIQDSHTARGPNMPKQERVLLYRPHRVHRVSKNNLNNNPRLCTSLQDGNIFLGGLASGSLPDWFLVGNVGIYYLRTI